MKATNHQKERPDSLYELLNVSKRASKDEIKKAYYRQALLYHPDKVVSPDLVQEATVKFQQLGIAYKVLSSDSLRKRYDATGLYDEYDDEGPINSDDIDWKSYFNSIFNTVTVDAIEKVRLEYQGSAEEKKDLLHSYRVHKGNLDKIFQEILFSDYDFEQTQSRLIRVIQEELDANPKLKLYPDFIQGRGKEACEARILKLKKMNKKFLSSTQKENTRDNSLPVRKRPLDEPKTPSKTTLVLPDRKKSMDLFLTSLAKKYAKNAPTEIGEDPLSDEQFELLQKKRLKKRNTRSK